MSQDNEKQLMLDALSKLGISTDNVHPGTASLPIDDGVRAPESMNYLVDTLTTLEKTIASARSIEIPRAASASASIVSAVTQLNLGDIDGAETTLTNALDEVRSGSRSVSRIVTIIELSLSPALGAIQVGNTVAAQKGLAKAAIVLEETEATLQREIAEGETCHAALAGACMEGQMASPATVNGIQP